jgi:hypothetical protein
MHNSKCVLLQSKMSTRFNTTLVSLKGYHIDDYLIAFVNYEVIWLDAPKLTHKKVET